MCGSRYGPVTRGADCEVTLHDPSVSRVQFEIRVMDGRAFLCDVESRWGTLVNSDKTSSTCVATRGCHPRRRYRIAVDVRRSPRGHDHRSAAPGDRAARRSGLATAFAATGTDVRR
ncbi:MAG: FHA domain-containing protein [Planctomycetales bacterium]|nr:FHA domain-containing protein [Planctomycetales bacterium]